MTRLRPGWLVVLFAAVIAISGWLPWRTTTADGGGHSSAIGGWVVGYFGPPSKFDAGQLIVLLASGLIVAGAMTARGLSVRVSAVAALALSLSIAGLTVVYYQQKIHPPVHLGYGFYIAAAATVIAVVCSVWALVSALSENAALR